MTRYTTSGMTDGKCGHWHHTMKQAVSCMLARRKVSPYSDRTIKKLVDGKELLLNTEETIKLMAVEKELRKNVQRS